MKLLIGSILVSLIWQLTIVECSVENSSDENTDTSLHQPTLFDSWFGHFAQNWFLENSLITNLTRLESNKTEIVETETDETKINENELNETESNKTESNETETNNWFDNFVQNWFLGNSLTNFIRLESNETEIDETETDETEINEIETDENESDEIESDEIESDETKTNNWFNHFAQNWFLGNPWNTNLPRLESNETEIDETETDKTEINEIESDETVSDEIDSDETESDEIESDETKTNNWFNHFPQNWFLGNLWNTNLTRLESTETEVNKVEKNERKTNEIEHNDLKPNEDRQQSATSWFDRFSNFFQNELIDSSDIDDDNDSNENIIKKDSLIEQNEENSVVTTTEDQLHEQSFQDDMDQKRCTMLNGSIGSCQLTTHCMMQDPEIRQFTVCGKNSFDENGEITLRDNQTPEKVCCPKITVSIEELKQKFEELLNKPGQELFALGLPKNPDGHCGMVSVSNQPSMDFENDFDDDSDEDEEIDDEDGTFFEQNFNHHIHGNDFEFNEEVIVQSQTSINSIRNVRNSKSKRKSSRIVLGRNARIGQIPWMASIYYRGQFICGGSIISQHHIVTAAHCFSSSSNPFEYTVRYGSVLMHNGTFNTVRRLLVHEKYHPPSIYSDIALLTLNNPIHFSTPFVQPICLPGKKMFNKLMVGHRGFVAGFGDLSFGGKPATVLQQVDVNILDNRFCDQNYQRLVESEKKFPNGIGKSLICAGHENGQKDACQGDSGGPLTLEYRGASYLIGVVSFGYRCALAKFPGVYTCVANYLKWIFENLQIDD